MSPVSLADRRENLGLKKDATERSVEFGEAVEGYFYAMRAGREAYHEALNYVRATGDALSRMNRSRGKRRDLPQHAAPSEYTAALQRVRISERTAQVWQQIAAIPEKVFKAYLSSFDTGDTTEWQDSPSIRGLLAARQELAESSYEKEKEQTPEEREAEDKEFEAWRKKVEAHRPAEEPSPSAMLPRREPSPEVWSEASAVIEAGYKVRAKQLHPDRGGDGKQMADLNLAIEMLRQWQSCGSSVWKQRTDPQNGREG
jgi:hypothetical protein